MKIITVSREFGSGGRELGKRISDVMGVDYYDKEIITAIASNKNLDEGYVEKVLENHAWRNIPLHFRCTFSGTTAAQQMQTKLLVAQKEVIEAIAKSGKNCVIVGRNADILLREYAPFNIFVCADMEARVQRSMQRANENEKMSRREMERKIRDIDKSRSQNRQVITSVPWGERTAYHLTVNTTQWSIKELAPVVAEFAERWFDRREI